MKKLNKIHASMKTRITKIQKSLQKMSLTFRFFPSNGNVPLTNVYRITPNDQTSTSGPSYLRPKNNSGAA